MKYFSLNEVKRAYQQISTTTKDKFWGILGILYSIENMVEPCKIYSIDTPKLSTFLEDTFRLRDKKLYDSGSDYSVVFSNTWEDKTSEYFLVGKPNIMPIIIWAYRNIGFTNELDAKALFEKFVNDFHISRENIGQLFTLNLGVDPIEYKDALYSDEDLLKELGGTSNNEAATVKMNKQFVVANAGDLSRGPFFQPLYASLNTLECLIIFPFNTNDYYDVFKSPKPNNLYGADTRQVIYYGCPGSGKSYKVKDITEIVDKKFLFRTTFHPDTDYASFVGCYKPHSNNRGLLNGNDLTEDELLQCFFDSKDEAKYKGEIKARYFYEYLINTSDIRRLGLNATDIAKKLDDLGFDKTKYTEASLMSKLYDWLHDDGYVTESTIAYKFCPQVFTNAYVQAWKNPDENVYLIIEEINRGNCAQIFGDLFQLLDRKSGVSEYPVKADKDLVDHLVKELGKDHEGIKDGELKLPSNLIIYATMNTSDQSLFPMDSAFKRRWDWEYVPIEYGADKESYNYIITIEDKKYRWVDFLKIVNEKIYDTTRSEDKQMGNFFIKKSIDTTEFINKVMFYLWNEVCKEEAGTSRNFFRIAIEGNNDGQEFKFVDLFDKANTNNILIGFMNHLKVKEYTE